MKQVCKAFLLVLLGLSGVAQESTAPSVAIPIIARGSHHRPISVTVESLVITDQKTPISGASLLQINIPPRMHLQEDRRRAWPGDNS